MEREIEMERDGEREREMEREREKWREMEREERPDDKDRMAETLMYSCTAERASSTSNDKTRWRGVRGCALAAHRTHAHARTAAVASEGPPPHIPPPHIPSSSPGLSNAPPSSSPGLSRARETTRQRTNTTVTDATDATDAATSRGPTLASSSSAAATSSARAVERRVWIDCAVDVNCRVASRRAAPRQRQHTQF